MQRKKVLIMRFSSLGDVVLVHPVIKKLFDNGYKVDLLTKKKYKKLFEYNPCINEILILEEDKNLFNIVKKIKTNNYYKILDLHRNLRTAYIKFFFFYKTITYKKYFFRRYLLFHFKINFLKGNSVIMNYLGTLGKLGLQINKKDLEYSIYTGKPPGWGERVKKILKKKMITIAPFAGHYTKEWVYYKELIDILGKKYNIIVIGEQMDSHRAEGFNQKNLFNLCGKLDLIQITQIISKSKLLITNDSGIMHLGCGTGRPVISIFGSTVREFGFMPLRKNTVIIENDLIKCRPCHYHGRVLCPEEHFKCMREITIDRVLDDVRKYIKI